MTALSGIVILCLSLTITACGGDDDSAATTSQASTEPGTSTEPGPGEATAPSKDATELAGCLEKAGYKSTVLPPPAEGVPGSEFGSTGTVSVDVGQGDKVVAVFFENPKRAAKLAKSALAVKAEGEVIGSVHLTATKGRLEELNAFRSCLKR